jgi:O-6-methylguanine DNA methyltransferase
LLFGGENLKTDQYLQKVFPGYAFKKATGDDARESREILEAFFKGGAFTPTFDLHGTAFQQSVWRAIAAIPHGHVETYGEIARKLGRPRASRAVGQAAGKNPVPILIPCHRVVGGAGALGGFTSGLPMKKKLLGKEGLLPTPR